MKKIILFTVVGVFGLLANAATITWGADVIGNGAGGEASDGWLAYFVEAASNSAGISALQSKDFSFLTGARESEVDGGEVKGYITGLGNSQTVTGYMVLFNSDDTATATYAYVTGVQSGSTTALGGGGQINFDIEDDTASFSNWTVNLAGGGGGTDVPEPTSGLLLLVGGAMLALRRKRA